MTARRAASGALVFLAACAGAAPLLPPRLHVLGVPGRPEWAEFAGERPEGRRLAVRLRAAATPDSEHTLFLRQADVKREWHVSLNGRRLGRLLPQEVPTVLALPVPAGLLRDGDNDVVVEARAADPPDDIRVGDFRVAPRPPAQAVGEAQLQVLVLEGGRAVPARLTVIDAEGYLAPLTAPPDQKLAVRPGVVYTADGHARFALPAGRYTLVATRGPEYGLDRRSVKLAAGGRAQFVLELRREVSTPGWAACDPHLHTLSFSGHGDATDDERAATIAGEGLELAVASEHNRHETYAPAAARMGVRDRFTPVAGNELTSAVGHFNVFPVEPGTPAPPASARDWPALLAPVRDRIVILNHPRDRHAGYVPFGPENFHPVTGVFRRGGAPVFTALELVNSGALRTDLYEVYRDWFALLNAGHRVFGVGASDSHDVNRFIAGQARTYVAVPDAEPGRIDLDAAARAFREGRLLVSLGLFVQARVNDRYGVGDLATDLGPELSVSVTVQGPSWAQVDRVELFADGVRIRDERLPAVTTLGGVKFRHTWRIPRPPHDVHLVVLAGGPGVRELFWPIPKPYQPDGPVWEPRVLGSTNPIWVDADGDGRFTPARLYAERLLERHGGNLEELLSALGGYDEAVAAQAAGLLEAAGRDLRGAEFARLLSRAPEPARRGFAAYLAFSP
ncbi:MAG TPA: CehA/McbA family metallohydrolase [Planctomycetota bacterium]|nr:CehA/McbA family metallohydrolase [Planctomycetota bacterium]